MVEPITVPVTVEVPPEVYDEAKRRADGSPFDIESFLSDYVEFEVEYDL